MSRKSASGLPLVSWVGFPRLSFCLIRSCYLVARWDPGEPHTSKIDVGFSSGNTTESQYFSGNHLWLIPYLRHVRPPLKPCGRPRTSSSVLPYARLLLLECFQDLPSTGFHLEYRCHDDWWKVITTITTLDESLFYRLPVVWFCSIGALITFLVVQDNLSFVHMYVTLGFNLRHFFQVWSPSSSTPSESDSSSW